MKETINTQSCEVLLCIIKECQTGKKYTGYDTNGVNQEKWLSKWQNKH